MTHHMLPWLVIFLIFGVPLSEPGCSEVDSLTEAVVGTSFMLGCISCKRREEVPASTLVDWHFRPLEENDFQLIFQYEHPNPVVLRHQFEERLEWAGTMGTEDLQVGAIIIHNVTFNDTGTYRCSFTRTLHLPPGDQVVIISKEVELSVVYTANRELVAVVSEILMYVLIVALQLWMIGILIYCYKKSAAERDAREARLGLHDPELYGHSKGSCDGVHLD